MRALVALVAPALLLAGVLVLGGVASVACDDTPRGEQGIDFLSDGSLYNVPPGPDAGPDAHGPCTEETDSTGICAQVSAAGTPYNHLIACTGGQSPLDITCMPTGATPIGGATTFCCTTGPL